MATCPTCLGDETTCVCLLTLEQIDQRLASVQQQLGAIMAELEVRKARGELEINGEVGPLSEQDE